MMRGQLFALFAATRDRFNYRDCFHADRDCSSVVNAHSISRKRVLAEIAEDGHVLMMQYRLHEGLWEMGLWPTGVRQATTFTGFCSYHDRALFAPLDTKPYSPCDREQEFLYAYRAIAREWQAKHTSNAMWRHVLRVISVGDVDGTPELRPLLDYPSEKLRRMSGFISQMLTGQSYALARLESHRASMRTNLAKKRFTKIRTIRVLMPKQYHLAVSSSFYLERDFEGNSVNDLAANRNLAPVFMTVVPQRGETHVLLSYESKNEGRFDFLREELANSSESWTRTILSNIIATNVENLAISPSRWESLPMVQRERFQSLCQATIMESALVLVPDPRLDIFV